MRFPALALLAPALLVGTPLPAETPPAEVSIPFASRDGIQDYKPDGDRGLYIRGITGDWYYARTQARCARLATSDVIGFETSAADTLDKFGALRAQGWRCPLASLTHSAPPPKKAKRG